MLPDLVSHVLMDQHFRVRLALATTTNRPVRTEIEVDEADPLPHQVHVIDCERTRSGWLIGARWTLFVMKAGEEFSIEKSLIIATFIEEGP